MLRSLAIRQMAVIEALDLEFAPGLNVLTGETGAGKSILIQALALLCGAKATAELIRTDAEEATVEGVFEGVRPEGLAAHGIPAADELVVRRVIYRNGRSRAWANGANVSTAQLASLAADIVRIYGQHEQTALLRTETHRDILDVFARADCLRDRMAAAYAEWREARERAARATELGRTYAERLELLRFQAAELCQAAVSAGEELALQAEREKLRHVEKLKRLCSESEAALDSGEGSVLQITGRVAHELADAARIDPTLSETAELVSQAQTLLREAAFELRRYADRLDFDPERFTEVEDRLALIARLKRKYGCTADELPQVLSRIESEIAELEHSELDSDSLSRACAQKFEEARAVALELSRLRAEAARELEQKIGTELEALGMAKATLRVVIRDQAEYQASPGPADPGKEDEWLAAKLGPHGWDDVEFHFSANPGEEPRSLARIASGGELSRVMLALKVLAAVPSQAALWVFDEVDAGIGGTVATAVGKRLRILAERQQVLCITHLPQIAAFADHHLAVAKHVRRGRTFTSARSVTGEERVRELARMLGNAGPESERYVRELLAQTKGGPKGASRTRPNA
ncbi:MAG: DNA repair protein RecN [Candidatus Binatia bacterium]|nr:MAG: DNA repair protein RecN [Candidatus Binatia bacterium]